MTFSPGKARDSYTRPHARQCGLPKRAPTAGPGGYTLPPVDRRLAQKNLRTALIAGAICCFVFAMAFVAAFVY